MSKIRACLLALVALAIAPLLVHAQDVPAWPPDPDTIFAPGVEVVGIQIPSKREAEKICGENLKASPGNGEWRYFTDNPTGKIGLCFTETGEVVYPPLSTELLWDTFLNIPSVSLGGKWIALMGYGGNDYTNDYFEIYSYNFETEHLNRLGHLDLVEESNHFTYWVSPTNGAFYSYSAPSSSPSKLYAFDATQPDSLRLAITGWLTHFDNPSRWEYLETRRFVEAVTGSRARENIPCTFTVYDSLGIDTYSLGQDCGGIRRVPDGYVYLRFEPPASLEGISYLMQLDRKSGEITELYDAEIESLDSASPDGRYAILMMDNNGKIDLEVRQPEIFDWRVLNPYVVILDTMSSHVAKIVYASETLTSSRLNSNIRNFEWRSNNMVLMIFENQVRFVTLTDYGFNEIVFTDVQNPIMLSPSNQLLLLGGKDANLIEVANLSSNLITPIAQETDLASYDYWFEWTDDDLLALTLRSREDRYTSNAKSVTYTIRIQ